MTTEDQPLTGMTVNELLKICQSAVAAGHGDAPVFFDSCAQAFKVHLVKVSSARFCEIDDPLGPVPSITLHFDFDGHVKPGSTHEFRKQLCEYLMENLP